MINFCKNLQADLWGSFFLIENSEAISKGHRWGNSIGNLRWMFEEFLKSTQQKSQTKFGEEFLKKEHQ